MEGDYGSSFLIRSYLADVDEIAQFFMPPFGCDGDWFWSVGKGDQLLNVESTFCIMNGLDTSLLAHLTGWWTSEGLKITSDCI